MTEDVKREYKEYHGNETSVPPQEETAFWWVHYAL